jgi:hypothetical protein
MCEPQAGHVMVGSVHVAIMFASSAGYFTRCHASVGDGARLSHEHEASRHCEEPTMSALATRGSALR